MIFVELSWFNQRVRDFLADDELRKLQSTLLENPALAPVMPDCGGLRKLRWKVAGTGKGKRGGCRVIYLNHPKVSRIDLVAIHLWKGRTRYAYSGAEARTKGPRRSVEARSSGSR